MNIQKDQDPNVSEGQRWRQFRVWLLIIGLWTWLFVDAYRRHSHGESWASVLGLPWDRNFLRPFGDFAIPVLLLVLMMQNIRKLPPSREKTTSIRIGWSLFVFLFVWELIRQFYLGPLRIL